MRFLWRNHIGAVTVSIYGSRFNRSRFTIHGSTTQRRINKVFHPKFHNGGRGIGSAVIDKHGLVTFDDAGGEHDVAHETSAFVIALGRKNLAAPAENLSRVDEVEQQDASRVSADVEVFFTAAVPVIDFEPAFGGANGRRAGPDPANVPGVAAAQQRMVITPEQEIT